MKTVYPDEKKVVLNENSVEIKPCINRESKSLDITIKLYSCQYINMKFLVVVTPPSIYHIDKYLIPTKWLKLALRIKFHPSLSTSKNLGDIPERNHKNGCHTKVTKTI